MSKFDKLISDFPDIYGESGYNPKYPVGFSCGEGWFNLLYDLSTDITNHIKAHPEAKISITQIKEKFSSLRYYYNGGDDVIDALVSKAEKASETICEVCGNPGEMLTSNPSGYGWYKTRCPICKDPKDVPMSSLKSDEDEEKPETD